MTTCFGLSYFIRPSSE